MEINPEELKIYMDTIFDEDKYNSTKGLFNWKLITKEQTQIIEYKYAEDLLNLFANCENSKTNKKKFVEYLKFKLEEADEEYINYINQNYNTIYWPYSEAGLASYTLIKLGLTSEFIDSLNKRRKNSSLIFCLFKDLLNEKQINFNIQELYYLLNILLKLDTHYNHESVKKKVLKTINSRNYLLIQDKIKGINLEINRDKQKVIEIIKYLDFDEKYNFFLMDIDKFLNSENPLVNSGMIGNLRAFMEGILGDIAKKIATNNKEEIPRYNHGKEELGWMGRVRQYLKINLDLSEKDHKLIDAYIDILHEEGGHSFISNKDYFRLSRNIGIEIVLLILSKFNQKYPKI